MLHRTLKTALALTLALGATGLSAHAGEKSHDRSYGYGKNHEQHDITVAIITQHSRQGLERELAQALEHALPHDINIVRNPSRADYVLEVRERYLNTSLRIKDRDQRWLTSPKSRHNRSGERIGWTEVSAIAIAQYDYVVVLKDRQGRVIDQDRFKGRVKTPVIWGEDLRIATAHGYRPYNQYPNAQIAALFACAPGTGQGPFTALREDLAQNLAHMAAQKTINGRNIYAQAHSDGQRYGIGNIYRGDINRHDNETRRDRRSAYNIP